MENCVISNVMTRRVSQRIQNMREGFLIQVEEYSATDSDSESEIEVDNDTLYWGHRGKTKCVKKETNTNGCSAKGEKLSNKQNTFSQNLVQMNPKDNNQVSKIPPSCYICNAVFNTMEELYFHGIAHSSKCVKYKENNRIEYFSCNICNAILKDRSTVRSHFSKHNHLRSQCTFCQRTFCSPTYLTLHMKHDHLGIKYKCPHCPKSYTQNVNLKQHMLSHEGIYFTCYHCGMNFTHRALLARHIQTHNEYRKCYKCKVCKRSMICPKVFKAHMEHHQGLSKYDCLLCAKKFVNKFSHSQHMKRHESPTEYKCDLCKRTYVDKKLLERHVRRHFIEDFVCQICGKAYVDQKTLDDHLFQHEGHSYPCNKCDKTYTYEANLKRHQRGHMKKRLMFTCAICNLKVTTKAGMRHHLSTHDKVRKAIHCKLCNTTVLKVSYSYHCKSMLHQEKLKKVMTWKLKNKLIKAEVFQVEC